jgi:hypothetical protein
MHIRALEPVSYGILCIDRLLQHADLEETAVVVVVWQDACDRVEPCVSMRVVYPYGAVDFNVRKFVYTYVVVGTRVKEKSLLLHVIQGNSKILPVTLHHGRREEHFIIVSKDLPIF